LTQSEARKTINWIMHVIYVTVAVLVLNLFSVTMARVEPASKTVFSDKKDGLDLAGLGIRKKGPINVYSVALYCAKGPCVKDCGSCDASKLAAKVADGNYAKEVVLKMSRNVGAEKMAGAISDAVAPRMKGTDMGVLNQLKEAMSTGMSGGCKTGTLLSFKAPSKSKMIFSINGKAQADLNSAALVRAFLNTYVDNKCVSPTLKSDLCTTISGWLGRE
jgi:hypothetical protein